MVKYTLTKSEIRHALPEDPQNNLMIIEKVIVTINYVQEAVDEPQLLTYNGVQITYKGIDTNYGT